MDGNGSLGNVTHDQSSSSALIEGDDWDGEERTSDFQIFYSALLLFLVLLLLVPLLRSVARGWLGHYLRRRYREAARLLRGDGEATTVAPEETADGRARRVADAAVSRFTVPRRDVPADRVPKHAVDQTECSVCLSPLDEFAVLLHCGHCFDRECVASWFASCVEAGEKNEDASVVVRKDVPLTCPLCKAQTRPPFFGPENAAGLPRPPPRQKERRSSRANRWARIDV